jgi:polyisoprenoid-binding protein YceI
MTRLMLIAAGLLATLPAAATTYTLESDYTQGVFRWNHLGFSSPAAQFSQGKGTLEFDPAQPARASITVAIPLDTLATGVPGLDEHFRSSDFFDLAHYPTATFQSVKVQRGAKDRLQVIGNLDLHGVVRSVTLDVTVVKVGMNPRSHLPTIGFDATTTLRRSDFGLGKYVPQVSDEIQLHLICQAVESTAYKAYLEAEAAAEASTAKQ